ncbi:integrase catalytic domain-containing protein [Trichonephila clavipes]|uniref:Integrase catalytic domain-containing protein n=1 Tax=Trichonephila clavipes TaxID=2585209 RepID=A0A8X6RB71_TRICX|nr:integrase catalytic domain-containing protein [Trichonephila clavipes]
MIKAATEIVEKQQNLSSDIVKCGISVDGTWQRRGYTSMNGCVAAISVDTGKVLDIEVMSSYCPTSLHLELVSDLTSEAFIASLKRFCARRGAPKHIYCYNGTTFCWCQKKNCKKYLNLHQNLMKMNTFAIFISSEYRVAFFSPPVSPHFGGLWEAGVKSIKYHLKRVIGNANLTFEEFSTLLTQVEAILNSRPLVSLDCDNDPDSLNILTPSHFLIGEVITSSPEHTNDDQLPLHSRWDIVQK